MSTVKVVFCGDSGVGKTAIIHRYVENEPGENLPSTIAATYKKLVTNDKNGQVIIELWNTAGDEKYSSYISCFFKDANVIVIVYDITDIDTFQNVENKWIKTINDNSQVGTNIIIVGNKVDKNGREVSSEQGEKCQQNLKAYNFFETSAINGQNIGDLFQCIASAKINYSVTHNRSVKIKDEKKKKKKCCK